MPQTGCRLLVCRIIPPSSPHPFTSLPYYRLQAAERNKTNNGGVERKQSKKSFRHLAAGIPSMTEAEGHGTATAARQVGGREHQTRQQKARINNFLINFFVNSTTLSTRLAASVLLLDCDSSPRGIAASTGGGFELFKPPIRKGGEVGAAGGMVRA